MRFCVGPGEELPAKRQVRHTILVASVFSHPLACCVMCFDLFIDFLKTLLQLL